MGTVVHRSTLMPIYNINLSKYDEQYWWFDPNLSAVINTPWIYWQETNGAFSVMSQANKDIVDTEELAKTINHQKKMEKRRIDNEPVLRAFAEVMIDEVNILRSQHSLSARTLSQLVTAIKNKIDAG